MEVAAGSAPGKGAVVGALVQKHALAGCLYAGDDRPDLDAFAALDQLAASGVATLLTAAGIATLKVAVRSAETPFELVSAADVVVDSPAGLVRLLSEL